MFCLSMFSLAPIPQMCHVTSQENFWVTGHGKVVSIKCHNEQMFSAIIYFI